MSAIGTEAIFTLSELQSLIAGSHEKTNLCFALKAVIRFSREGCMS